ARAEAGRTGRAARGGGARSRGDRDARRQRPPAGAAGAAARLRSGEDLEQHGTDREPRHGVLAGGVAVEARGATRADRLDGGWRRARQRRRVDAGISSVTPGKICSPHASEGVYSGDSGETSAPNHTLAGQTEGTGAMAMEPLLPSSSIDPKDQFREGV